MDEEQRRLTFFDPISGDIIMETENVGLGHNLGHFESILFSTQN